MSGIGIRTVGRAGRITLRRPGALNALTYEMVLAIDAALDGWAEADAVSVVVIDAEGPKAFCAGGDLDAMYRAIRTRDYGYARGFWRDEYRMNARIAEYPKPVVCLMQGYTMGGGVGVGCHGSHRVVGDTSRIAMPECGVGLVPDVGGSWLLARAPGRLGEYLGVTAARMGPGDAIRCGFADLYVPENEWPALVARLEAGGAAGEVEAVALPPPEGPMAALQEIVDAGFSGETLPECLATLDAADIEMAAQVRRMMAGNSPLSMACTLALVRQVRARGGIRDALAHEFRFTWRSVETGDFGEGIRARIIDKDNAPHWRHESIDKVQPEEVAAMLAPLGADELTWTEDAT